VCSNCDDTGEQRWQNSCGGQGQIVVPVRSLGWLSLNSRQTLKRMHKERTHLRLRAACALQRVTSATIIRANRVGQTRASVKVISFPCHYPIGIAPSQHTVTCLPSQPGAGCEDGAVHSPLPFTMRATAGAAASNHTFQVRDWAPHRFSLRALSSGLGH
jgi:hypothetical protein